MFFPAFINNISTRDEVCCLIENRRALLQNLNAQGGRGLIKNLLSEERCIRLIRGGGLELLRYAPGWRKAVWSKVMST